MTRFLWILLLVTAAPALAAQNPPDTSDEGQVQELRRQIRRRWNERVGRELNLSDAQAAKLRATEDRFFERRREIAQRQRAVNEALRGQLQPGVAANSDSVRKLMDAREQHRQAFAQLERDEDQEIAGYLNPVQHARYEMMREQLRRRIQEIREQRRARGQMMGPRGGMRPPPEGRPRGRP